MKGKVKDFLDNPAGFHINNNGVLDFGMSDIPKGRISDKYDITKHPNYKYLSDANPKNAFDIEKFLSTKLKLKPEEEFEVFDAGAAAGSESA